MDIHQNSGKADNDLKGRSEKFMIFSLCHEAYGVPLSVVREVIALAQVTRVPNMPAYFHGLINLRGSIISVIDLRKKLNLSEHKFEEKKTCIIISEIDDFVLGFIVDDIQSVVGLHDEDIQKDIQLQSKVDHEYISGVAKRQDGLTIILEMGKILNIEELRALKKNVA